MTAATWRNRIVGHGEEAPEELCANPRNWRLHPTRQQDALEAVIDDIGFIRSVTVNRRSGYVLDGHLRVLVAMRQNVAAVPVEYVDLSPEEEAEALASMDPIGALAVSDGGKLDELMQDIQNQASDPVAELLDELLLSAPLDLGDQAPEKARQIGSERSVKAVINCGDVATVERALSSTGLVNRGAALVEICRRALGAADAAG